ncbi:hypothetical protein ABPG75_000105 [Micractinium tetrahymenae]
MTAIYAASTSSRAALSRGLRLPPRPQLRLQVAQRADLPSPLTKQSAIMQSSSAAGLVALPPPAPSRHHRRSHLTITAARSAPRSAPRQQPGPHFSLSQVLRLAALVCGACAAYITFYTAALAPPDRFVATAALRLAAALAERPYISKVGPLLWLPVFPGWALDVSICICDTAADSCGTHGLHGSAQGQDNDTKSQQLARLGTRMKHDVRKKKSFSTAGHFLLNSKPSAPGASFARPLHLVLLPSSQAPTLCKSFFYAALPCCAASSIFLS